MNTAECSITDQLEALIDKHGLQPILIGLGWVCDEKAEHISTGWQDRQTAREWRTAAGRLGALARKTEI